MTNSLRHPFHLVDNSPWPVLSALFALGLAAGGVRYSHIDTPLLMVPALAGIYLTSFQWWRDVAREATLMGLHSTSVELGIRWGMVLFICSEVLFFVSFFWGFFYASLSPAVEGGATWPPLGVQTFNPLGVPLLNSIVLLLSGVSVTWSHHSTLSLNHWGAKTGLGVTVLLGFYFTSLQGLEYWEASFSYSEGVFGSLFFIATGFHGIHVIVGSIFLSVCLWRLMLGAFSCHHHTGLEIAAWYWHFVDVVWLFLYLWVYVWGS